MDKSLKTRQEKRQRRQIRVRARVTGISECPRLNVHRSLTSIYAQLIDDTQNKVLVSVHSKNIDSKGDAGERKGRTAIAYLVGRELATKAKEAKIGKVVFDRAGYQYHGRVQALADGASDGGLVF